MKKILLIAILFATVLKANDRSGKQIEDINFPKEDIIFVQGSEISPVVGHYEGYYSFVVSREDKKYNVISRLALIKIKKEFELLDSIRKNSDDSFVWKGFVDATKGIGNGLVSVVTDTGSYAKNVFSATGKFIKKVGSDGLIKAYFEDSSAKRKLASKMGLDYYSSNPEVQDFLKVASDGMNDGKLIMDALTFVIPIPALSITVSVGKLNSQCENILIDKSPSEIMVNIQDGLKSLGMRDSQIQAFLKHEYVNPRTMIYFKEYITKLKKIMGAGFYPFENIKKAKTKLEIDTVMYQLEFYTRLHDAQTISEFFQAGDLIGCLLTKNYQNLIVVPYDYFELNIPNTTNAIDGHFADLKNKLRNHNGLSINRKKKFIDGFLKV